MKRCKTCKREFPPGDGGYRTPEVPQERQAPSEWGRGLRRMWDRVFPPMMVLLCIGGVVGAAFGLAVGIHACEDAGRVKHEPECRAECERQGAEFMMNSETTCTCRTERGPVCYDMWRSWKRCQ